MTWRPTDEEIAETLEPPEPPPEPFETTYTCPHCLAVSANPTDKREGYCGRCHRWGDEL